MTKLVIDAFCDRQFRKDYKGGSKVLMGKKEFLKKVVELLKDDKDSKYGLVDGYAPFCKHIFVPNFAGCFQNYLKINEDNRKFIETEYQARRKEELPVLSRFIRRSVLQENGKSNLLTKGKVLDLILYSKKQLDKENKGIKGYDSSEKYNYGIVAIKCIAMNKEVPMNPITMMRNCLGIKYGGSGVELDEKKYRESVAFWKDHVIIS